MPHGIRLTLKLPVLGTVVHTESQLSRDAPDGLVSALGNAHVRLSHLSHQPRRNVHQYTSLLLVGNRHYDNR